MSGEDEWMGDIRDDSPLHELWSKAKDHPDYNKSEWMALEKKLTQRNCSELFSLVNRALYLIDPMAISHLTFETEWRGDAEVWIRDAVPIIFNK